MIGDNKEKTSNGTWLFVFNLCLVTPWNNIYTYMYIHRHIYRHACILLKLENTKQTDFYLKIESYLH